VVLGRNRFSAPSDYVSYLLECGAISAPDEAWTSPELALAIQRHWFWQGQVGCLFARRASRYSQPLGWETCVLTPYPREMSQAELKRYLKARIVEATLSPTCELLSFLFPRIREPAELVRLIRAITSTRSVTLVRRADLGQATALSLQSSLAKSKVKAWLLGFGPFEHIPPTRRAPSVEIIIRPKVKPASLFHQVNQDRSVSHLADMPLHISDAYAEMMWQETLRSVERILGHRPDRKTAATTTFCVPRHLWDQQL